MNRIDIINHLIEKNGYKRYLEIGVWHGDCFNAVECETKHSVDPKWPATYEMTSDEFFDQNKEKYDIIFIDGLHTWAQAHSDAISSFGEALAEGGAIVMHDCDPINAEEQTDENNGGSWTGTVWKAIAMLRAFDDLDMHVVECDHGVGIIRKGEQEPAYFDEPWTTNFAYFVSHRSDILCPISPEEFLERY